MVWVLVLALPVHGVSNALLQVVGGLHRHSVVVGSAAASLHSTAQADTAWSARSALRTLVAHVAGPGALQMIDAMHARDQAWARAAELKNHPFTQTFTQPVAPSADTDLALRAEQAHQHAHDTFQRHTHDPRDGSVVALGEQAAKADATGSASALDAGGGAFPLPALLDVQALAPTESTAAWRHVEPQAWRSHVITPLDRPPQA